MPVDRPDHLARIRGEAPSEEPPEGAPVVRPELIEYLEAHLDLTLARGSLATSQDDLVHLATAHAFIQGKLSLIAHLKTLVAH